jgi:hypothetical protein
MHRPGKIEKDVEILCNKPSPRNNCVGLIGEYCETIFLRTTDPSKENFQLSSVG